MKSTMMLRVAVMLVTMLITATSAWADPYSWDATTKTLTVNTNISNDVWPIHIGEATIAKTDVEHLVIANGVTSIGGSTFKNCTNLITASISNGVTCIESSAFYDCTSLTTINIPDNTSFTRIEDYCFSGCTKLTSITLPVHVDIIGVGAFYGSGLTSFPNCSVTTIEQLAFYGCSGLTSITIPATVTKICENAFSGCGNMTTVKIYNQNKSINGSDGIEAGAFSNSVKYLVIPSIMTHTHDNYFADFQNNKDFYVFYEGTKSQWENAEKEGWDWVPTGKMCYYCTVNFDMGGACANPASQTVFPVKDLVAYEESPTATGYEFGGWYLDDTYYTIFKGTIPFNYAYLSNFNVTIYAKWTPTYYNVVTFDTGGKSTTPANQDLAMNMKATWPAVPSYHNDSDGKDYYVEGWYTNEACTGDPYDFNTAVVNSFTLYAKWVTEATQAHINITTTGIDNAGTVTLTAADGRKFGGGAVPLGVYTLTITPSRHYYKHSGSITYADRPIDSGSGSSLIVTPVVGEPTVTFEDVELTSTYQVNVTYQDATVTVNFDEVLFVLALTVSPEEAGTVTGGLNVSGKVENVTINGPGNYEFHYCNGSGLPITLSPRSNEGYRFGVVNLSKNSGTGSQALTPASATSISYDSDQDITYTFPEIDSDHKHYVGVIHIDFIRFDGTPTIGTQTTDLIMAKEGFGTYYNSVRDVHLAKGMKARIVTANEGTGALTYQTIADGYAGTDEAALAETGVTTRIVPAGVAVMLQTAAGEESSVSTLTLKAHTDGRTFASNLLHGSDEATTTDGGDAGAKYYKLSYNTSGTTIGWYWGGTDGAAFTSEAHKAWLVLPSTASARYFALPEENDGATSMEEGRGKREDVEGVWYCLDGRKLSGKPTEKGVYIRNGRKEVIK